MGATTNQGGTCAYQATGVSATSTTFTDSTAGPFKSTDVGANITIHGAGPGATDLVTTITATAPPNSATLAVATSNSASGVKYIFGAAGGAISSNWTTTISVTLANGQQIGDGLCVASNDDPAHANATVADTAGNAFTQRGTTQSNADYHQLLWTAPVSKTMAGGTNSITVTFGALEAGFSEMGWRHFVGASQFGQVAQGNSSNTSVTAGAFTNTVAAGSAIWFFTGVGQGITSVAAGYTATAVSPFSDVEAYQIVSTAGSFTASATQSPTGLYVISAVTMVPTPSSGLPVQRTPGFPPGAPLPGIVRLGTGVLSQASGGISIANIYPGGFLEGDGVLGAFAPAPSVLPAGHPTGETSGAGLLAWAIMPAALATTESLGAHALTPGVSLAGLQSEEYLGAWAASFAGVASPILAQQRAPGFPLAAPMPGIAQLGHGLLVSTTRTVSVSLVYPGGFLEGDGLFGAAVPAASVLPAGSFTEERYGASAAASAVLPGGLDTRDAQGAAAPAPSVLPGGLQSPSDLGAIVDASSVLPGGLFTEERAGAQSPAPSVLPSGFLTLEVFGAGVPVPSVLAAGTSALEAFGAMTEATVIAIQPSSVDTQERFGAPASGPTVLPSGFLTLEVLGAGVPAPVLLPAGTSTLEFFGAMTEATVIAIQPSGLETLERFGASAWVPSLLPAGFDTPLAFGASAPTPSVLPAGTFTFEAYGAQTLSQVVGLQPASAASEERFGATYAASRVLPSAMNVSEQLGAYVAGPNFYAASLSTTETFGATIVAVGVSIQPASLDTYERFGSTYVTVGIQPSSVTIGEPFGVPTFSQSLALSGLDPFDRLGAMVAAQIVGFPVYGSGIDSWETFGSLGAFKRLVPVVILQPSRVVYPVLAPTWPSRQP